MVLTYVNPASVAPPPPPHTYPHGIRYGDLLFISGQVAFDAAGDTVGIGDARAQAEQVYDNIKAVCEEAGGSIQDVVKITVLLTDIRHADDELSVRLGHFPEGRFPTCTMVQVANLGLPELLMEIEAVAVIGSAAAVSTESRS
ncbi:RidA family protein [Nocardioides sp.]|uniref:RidA family protein n=1 Tax=Nocardioides sp. TaxID=35761 RepID=UPI0025EE7ADA|nr:RidA family protein [Nocardioides sp.]